MVRTLKQDRNGNIWLAATEGIIRYDGKAFTNITSAVSSARFFSLLEDRKGNFWFSSVGSGVYHYDGKSFRNFTTRDGLASNRVSDIYEDKTGNIWFGTESGASRYDGKSFRNYVMHGDSTLADGTGKSFLNLTTREARPHQDDNDVNAVIEDIQGKFWFGTRGNACFYDGKTFTVFTHQGKPFTNVRSIIEDKKGSIWLGGNDGLWRYDGRTFTNFTQHFVGYVYEDRKGNIWTSSKTGRGWVLSRYEEKSLSNKKPSVTEIDPKPERGIFGILEANDGSIWFCSDGVYRYDGKTITDFKDKAVQE